MLTKTEEGSVTLCNSTAIREEGEKKLNMEIELQAGVNMVFETSQSQTACETTPILLQQAHYSSKHLF